MAGKRQYEIVLDTAIGEHLAAVPRRDRVLLLDTIEEQLTHDAAVPARNRKPLRIPNAINATWELRCGANNRYRVFYDVDQENGYVVVLAIGSKEGGKLTIGREEFTL
jgi:mRNA-degrading endonuclease RelE of RelBE toxin-antitoxin system